MISDETKRAIRKCLLDNGFDANIVDELVIERKKLRDEFAMSALSGMLAGRQGTTRGYSMPVTEEAYKVADAMLDRRK